MRSQQCEKDHGLLEKMIELDRKDLDKHLKECSVCASSLKKAYRLYKDKKKEPILNSFPPYDSTRTLTEFLDAWVISLVSKRDRLHHYATEINAKMANENVRTLTIGLIQELIKSLKAKTKQERLDRYKSLSEIIEILDGEFFQEEFKLFLGHSKEELIEIIEDHLLIEEDKDKLLPRK
ncbi:MAG: hypothetical protein ACQEP3_01650 [Patescibacteria group bacterium]